MVETLFGTLFGGLFRLAPEIMKLWDRKNERAHEALMFDKQVEQDRLRASAEIDRIHAQSAGAVELAELQGLIAATEAQGKPSGNTFADAINTLMRPLITFWWVIVLYTLSMAAQFYILYIAGNSVPEAYLKIWGPEEKAIVASIISFWFMDRSIRKGHIKL